MKNVYIFLLLMMAIACSKNNNPKGNGSDKANLQALQSLDLSGKSLEEVLERKYSKAIFTCQLWSQYTSELDISGKPTDETGIDLKAGINIPQELKLRGVIDQHRVEAKISLVSSELRRNLTVTTAAGDSYRLDFSPSLTIKFQSKAVTFPGPFVASGAGSSQSINEKIKSVQLSNAVGPEPKPQFNGQPATTPTYSYRDYVECFIDTEIKPEFASQFQKLPR